MELVWPEFIVVLSVAKDVIFTHTPRIDLTSAGNYSITVLPSRTDLRDLLLLFIGVIALFELQFPEALKKNWPVEVVDIFQVLFLFLFLFFHLSGSCFLWLRC